MAPSQANNAIFVHDDNWIVKLDESLYYLLIYLPKEFLCLLFSSKLVK